jgi:hypothetical protein
MLTLTARFFVPAVLVLGLAAASPAPASAEPTAAQKLALKAAVLAHIERRTDDVAYHFIEPASTDLQKLRFVAMHPVVFERADGTYALCADFEDPAGAKVLVDYYVTDLNGEMVVLSSVVGKRSVLMRIAEKFDL